MIRTCHSIDMPHLTIPCHNLKIVLDKKKRLLVYF